MKILRIVLDGEEHPTYTITKAFQNGFDEVETIWWHQWYYQRDIFNAGLRDKLLNTHYDAIFMQIQEGGVVYPSTFEGVYEKMPIFNWTGDVRRDVDFYTPTGRQCITLFSNNSDPEKMRSLGFRSDYLQVGYDDAHYFETSVPRKNKIAFIGNNYPHDTFPQSRLRYEMVKALKERFGDVVEVYGNNWSMLDGRIRPTGSKVEERQLYNESLIAVNISHINLPRYYSDRQLRAMACGCMVLAQTYEDYEYEFQKGVQFDLWDGIEQLIERCEFYLSRPDEAIAIGKKAAEYVREKCTWDYRVKEFKELIDKYI